ncbi:MAG: ABC-F family ATP-binding cassette domain-containing protein [Candidatus Kapabacteria bacterium]|nr:ABC-F family ATP-binding cassette domain-containing protein [Candidatus Kapabacteria bacterium]
MTVFSSNNISKKFNNKELFKEISFGMEDGERIGIIGKNGAGKTTLLNIIAGIETPDTGNVWFNNNARVEYLRQEPNIINFTSVIDTVMNSRSEIFSLLEEHRYLCNKISQNPDPSLDDKLSRITNQLNNNGAWQLENDAKKMLSILGVKDFYKSVENLSGGLRKRVALARALISDPTLLIMDEPTNHLDADSVQWLQDRLMNSSQSLLFVTHDRYFLDAVATKIIEIDRSRIFSFPGNYEKYLEQKQILIDSHDSTIDHLRSKLRQELHWLSRGAKARRTKQKSRQDWIEILKDETKTTKEKKIKIELGKIFLGSRIIEAHNITKTLGQQLLFKNFTYIARPKDKIGIIGANGSGKSTLLNVLAGRMQADSGTVKIGSTIQIGFFNQENSELKDSSTVIGALREIAEYIDVGEGRDRYLTTKDLLNRFLFPPKQHGAFISTLSGGEKRRLMLLRVLMANPNVLLLDEPTNDFDIPTLNALEDYLDNFFGALIIVSHDRAFLDRCVDVIYSYEGDGIIKEYPGNYSSYLEKKEIENASKVAAKAVISENENKKRKPDNPKKLSYLEQRELNELEKNIPLIELEKADLEQILNSGSVIDYEKLNEISHKIVELANTIDTLTSRWLDLSDKFND